MLCMSHIKLCRFGNCTSGSAKRGLVIVIDQSTIFVFTFAKLCRIEYLTTNYSWITGQTSSHLALCEYYAILCKMAGMTVSQLRFSSELLSANDRWQFAMFESLTPLLSSLSRDCNE